MKAQTIQALSDKDLIYIVELIAQASYGGHYSILRFTGGYKAAFGTPDLRTGMTDNAILDMQSFPTWREAMCSLIRSEPCFYGLRTE